MKKIILLPYLLLSITCVYAQNFQIVFTGSGSSTVVDSVQAENLTQGTEITILGTDILNLVGQVGINPVTGAGNRGVTIFPNPTPSTRFIEFETEAPGLTQITVNDMAGKVIAGHQTTLPAGSHRFEAGSFPGGVYYLQIITAGKALSGKFISTEAAIGRGEITYLGSVANSHPNDAYKSNRSLIQMQYNFGDLLLFKCHSGNYLTYVPMVPIQSATVTAGFADCTDADGHHYATVTIGQQIWMAENLRTTRYSNGDLIPHVTSNTQWNTLTTGSYCNYNHDSTLATVYGRLYNGFTISDSRNVAPVGWHVATDSEWTTLSDYVGGAETAGACLKETGLLHWLTPNEGANNLYAFTALPAGTRESGGVFANLHYSGYWWTSTFNALNNLWYRGAYHSIVGLMRYDQPLNYGFSVRCVRN